MLEDELEKASKGKRSMIDRKIASNERKIAKLYKELSKYQKGTQKRVLDSISKDAKRRARGK